MTISAADRSIGIYLIESNLHVDRRYTLVTSADVAQFIDEYYPEMFEGISTNEKAYVSFIERLDTMAHYSFAELAIEYLADEGTVFDYEPLFVLATLQCCNSVDELEENFFVICDAALDGYLVFV